MYPQHFQGQAYAPQGTWGSPQFSPFTTNPNELINVIARILPVLQSQWGQFTPQTGFPQQSFPQGPMTNLFGQPGTLPFQFTPWTPQGSAFGQQQFSPQTASLVELVNVLSRALPMLQQSGVLGQQGGPFGFPQQHFGSQAINPEIAGVIARILPYLGTQANPFAQTGLTGFGSYGNPYIH